jgi:ubiquinone/menaquinone biosynthesis C-methylase UbiE
MQIEVSDLGPAGVYVAVVGLVLAGILVLAAFLQGREIVFWPPKIGARPERAASDRGDRTVSLVTTTDPSLQEAITRGGIPAVREFEAPSVILAGTSALGFEERLFDFEYTVRESQLFYEKIAHRYDARNSNPLLATHLEAARRIDQVLRKTEFTKVLDLGGGTGRFVALPFFNEKKIKWTYVDRSMGMSTEFRKNFETTRLGRSATILVEDLHAVLPRLETASFDVIVLSFVITSTAISPDFREIARLLAPGGIFIITDVDPGYTSLHPFYVVTVDGKRHALRSNPANPLVIASDIEATGLTRTELSSISASNNASVDRVNYSFMGVFRRER